MGGGKETPRQKMVGLMYLVLLALLAMNVSKSILDAFVAIEENIQIANENEFARGEEKKNQLKELTTDDSNPAVAEKATQYLKDVKKIEEKTAKLIYFLDQLKIKIMVACGEAITPEGENLAGTPEEMHLIHGEYDKKFPCKPTRMHLAHIQGADKYDEPMFVMGVSESINAPTGDGKQLWDDYNIYRKEILELLVKSASTTEKKYKLKVLDINEFSNEKGKKLAEQVDKMFAKGDVSPDEIDDLKKIYISLSKNEMNAHHDQVAHWLGKTFDHNPQVAGIASLSSMQKEILTARADAITLIRSRVGGGDYSFNKVEGFAFGDVIANSGDEVEINVMMAAFDSDKQPEVKPSIGTVSEVKDGIAKVKVKVSGGAEMIIKGKVGIAKKNGLVTYKDWEHTIKIMKPQGTVSLPEMNVLYRGYKNRIQGVASGYDQTVLSGNNVTLTKSGEEYIGSPGQGREASITVSGKNSVTNKTVSLGSFTFRVSNLPGPQVFLGTIASGSSVSKSAVANMTRLFAKYPPEIPLKAEFDVASWELTVSGAPRSIAGNGAVLSADAISLLKQAKPGSKVSISAKYKGMGYVGNMASVISIQ
jgi:gliding motility-associated protein GldM